MRAGAAGSYPSCRTLEPQGASKRPCNAQSVVPGGLPAADRGRLARLGRGEALDEIERGLRDLLPAVVDRERVASVRDLHDLRHPWVVLLPLVGGVRDRPRHRMVLLALDEHQEPRPWFLVFTFDSVHGLTFALPICTRENPEA